jgi:hypothetical protein
MIAFAIDVQCVSSRALETERTETRQALDGFLTGRGDWK